MDVKELNYALKIIVRERISKCSRKPDHPNLSSSSLLVTAESAGSSVVALKTQTALLGCPHLYLY